MRSRLGAPGRRTGSRSDSPPAGKGGRAIPVEIGLQQYLKQIESAELLTAMEERELASAIQASAEAGERLRDGRISMAEKEAIEQLAMHARERMIRCNLRLVVKIARQYMNRGMALADLVEEGNIGLLRAVEGFDPAKETRFSTYASWWIKQAIKRALINTVQPVHIPAYMVAMIADWKRAAAELESRNSRQPTIQEMAEHMHLSDRKVRIIRRAVKAFAAPTQSGGADGSFALSEMLPDHRSPSPEEAAFSNSDNDRIRRMLDRISEREATILRLRFGLYDAELWKRLGLKEDQKELTLKDIGAKIGLTRERVRQLEREALKRLKEVMDDE